MNAITLTGVVKRYGATEALSGLTLEVGRGEMFGLIGPDGAGKSTAIRLMCGLLHADAGDVRVLGRNPARDHRYITERVLPDLFELMGFSVTDTQARFLPVNMKDTLRTPVPGLPLWVRLYLSLPYRPKAGQMLVVAKNRGSEG